MDEYIQYLRELDRYLLDLKQSIKNKRIKIDPESDLGKVMTALYSFHELLKSAIEDDYKKLPEVRKKIESIIDTIDKSQKIKDDLSIIDSGSLEWILGYKAAASALVDMAINLHSSIEDNLDFYFLLEKTNLISKSLKIETDKLKFENGLEELAGLIKAISDSSKTTKKESIHKLAKKFHNFRKLLEYDAFILLSASSELKDSHKKLESASEFFSKFYLGEVSSKHKFTQSFIDQQTDLLKELRLRGPANPEDIKKAKLGSPVNTGFFGISASKESGYKKWEPSQSKKWPSAKK